MPCDTVSSWLLHSLVRLCSLNVSRTRITQMLTIQKTKMGAQASYTRASPPRIEIQPITQANAGEKEITEDACKYGKPILFP